jgi:hypothetical protein
MPIRLTPSKSLLISYDRASDTWVTLEGVALCLLSEYVDIEPGVTVEHIFKLIDRDASLKRFLAEYCSCDLDAIRVRVQENPKPIEVFTDVEWDDSGHPIPTGTAKVDTVVISPFYYTFTDENTGFRRLEGTYTLLGKSSKHDLCSISFGGPQRATYAEIKDFLVTLDTELRVDECDDDKCTEDDPDPIAFSAHVSYRLLDVLTAIVGHFGQPAFDPRYQKEIDDEIEMWERFNRKNDDPDTTDQS